MLNDSSVQHVFIVGSKGIPGNYGGYETFVDKLTEYHQNNPNLKYHVACKAKDTKTFEYHNADCFDVKAGWKAVYQSGWTRVDACQVERASTQVLENLRAIDDQAL